MSSKLVKKLLKVTTPGSIDASLQQQLESNKKKKRKQQNLDNDGVSPTWLQVDDGSKKEKLIQHHIATLMGFDRMMESKTKASGGRLPVSRTKSDRKVTFQKNILPTRKKKLTSNSMVFGNSRSSSSVLSNQPLQPTFQKRAHEKQRKEKKLKQIQKLLQTTKQKMTKPSSGSKSK